MKKNILSLLPFVVFLLLISCYPNEARMIDDFYEVEESSAAVGDIVTVVYNGSDCGTTFDGYSSSFWAEFRGLRADRYWEYCDKVNMFISTSDVGDVTCHFEVPPKAISSSSFFGKKLLIEYPEVLELVKNGNKVTVTSEKAFFNIDVFSKEKAKLLLDDGYPLIWLNGDSSDTRTRNEEKMSPLKNSSFYDLETITPYKVTFTIPEWAKSGKIHILNENGYLISEYDTTPLADVKIEAVDFEQILSVINNEDKTFIQSNYHEKDGNYCLNENVPTGEELGDNRNEAYKNIKRILRQSGYYDTHVLNIEPDPLDENAFFSSKEELIVN